MTTTFLLLCGMGIGAFIATVLMIVILRMALAQTVKARIIYAEQHVESIRELRRRNDLLINQNRYLEVIANCIESEAGQ